MLAALKGILSLLGAIPAFLDVLKRLIAGIEEAFRRYRRNREKEALEKAVEEAKKKKDTSLLENILSRK